MRRLLAPVALFVLLSAPAQAQVGALYRCPSNEYTNLLSAAAANARGCTKIAKAEWVVAASDSAGTQYEYNDRRTVFRGHGLIETWLQVVPPVRDGMDAFDARLAEGVKAVSRQVIECARRTIASGATYFFDPRDNTVVKDTSERSAFFPPPEPVAEELIRSLCADARAR
jgi:hypothetical protein